MSLLSPADYLRRILNARVYEVAEVTPLLLAKKLSTRNGSPIFLKREDLQPVFSFKLRGAYNKIANLSPERRKHGVICASAGNHAQGVALAAAKLQCRAVIVMPETTPEIKVDAVRALGGEVVQHGQIFDEAYAHAIELGKCDKLAFVHPFDDPDVIAGQGTIAMEVLRQLPAGHTQPAAIFCAVGGGGLIAGIAAYIKQVRPEIKVIGVETVDTPTMTRSLQENERIVLPGVGTFADGTAVKQVGAETFRLCRQWVDDMVLVDTDDICAAIKDVFEDTRCILEPSGAMAVAGAKAYLAQHKWRRQPVICVTSGANTNFDRLRFVAERAEYGEKREILLAVTLDEKPGAYKRFVSVIGRRNITEFNYRCHHAKEAHVFVGVQVANRNEGATVIESLVRHGYPTLDLTDNEVAKEHMRHLVGGHFSGNAQLGRERLLRFEFPERPGALMTFLKHMGASWNISLFHYRNHGSDCARVLVGLQIPAGDEALFGQRLDELGYRYWDECDNPVYRLFLG